MPNKVRAEVSSDFKGQYQSYNWFVFECRGQIPSVYLEESDTLIVGEHDGPPHKVLQATSGGSSSFTSANILGGNPNQGKSRNSRRMDGPLQISNHQREGGTWKTSKFKKRSQSNVIGVLLFRTFRYMQFYRVLCLLLSTGRKHNPNWIKEIAHCK